MVIPRPTTRLLALLGLLQARDRVGGAELARRLEVNGRSVPDLAIAPPTHVCTQ